MTALKVGRNEKGRGKRNGISRHRFISSFLPPASTYVQITNPAKMECLFASSLEENLATGQKTGIVEREKA